MKSLRIICILFLALALSGCSWWSKDEPEKTAEELAADGRMYFEKEKYTDAIKSYKKLRDWYPFSSHAKEAGLIIADSHYLMEEYDEAILAYNEYERMHPNDAKIPYVIYQTGMCDYDRIETIDRDATATRNALRTFQRLEEAFPESDYTRKAKPLIKTCLENLAAKEMDIALFYFKLKKYEAALKRFEVVVTMYPDFGLHTQAQDYMAKCRAHIGEPQPVEVETRPESGPDLEPESE
jgi:outer membrane protein assembly factor BamD